MPRPGEPDQPLFAVQELRHDPERVGQARREQELGREADLAMTELFGGFPAQFYQAYREAWPLESGYLERKEIYNLYHLLNHLNHFGSGYAASVEAVLRKFS